LGNAAVAGIYRYDTTPADGVSKWWNLTAKTSAARQTLAGNGAAAPAVPGPEDDFRFNFLAPTGTLGSQGPANPGEFRTWTDGGITYADVGGPTNNRGSGGGNVQPILYAALGTITSATYTDSNFFVSGQLYHIRRVDANNAVYRLDGLDGANAAT